MSDGQQTQLFRAELDVLTHAIQHHEVVACAVHLGELYEHLNKSICRAKRGVACSLIPRLSNLICLVIRTAPTSILPPKGEEAIVPFPSGGRLGRGLAAPCASSRKIDFWRCLYYCNSLCRKQFVVWSLTMPVACMKAYQIVEPT